MQLPIEILGKSPERPSRLVLFVLIFMALAAITATPVLWAIGALLAARPDLAAMFTEASPLFFFVNLGILALLNIACAIALRIVYARRYLSLINPLRHRVRPEIKALILFVVIAGFAQWIAFLPFGGEADYEVINAWQPQLWLAWIVPMSMIILLQIAFEELIFRGVLQQYLYAITKRAWVAILLPALLWASLHFANFEAQAIGYAAVFSTFLLGWIFGDWAYRTQSLFGPLVYHFFNNFIVICIYGNNIEPSDLHIFRVILPEGQNDFAVTAIMINSIVLALVYFLIIHRFLPNRTSESAA